MIRSRITDNHADRSGGGGVKNIGGIVRLVESEVSDNTAIGSIGAWMLGRALASLIVGVSGMELAALTPAGAALAAVAIAASVVPVTRAARVPVIEAIRDV